MRDPGQVRFTLVVTMVLPIGVPSAVHHSGLRV